MKRCLVYSFLCVLVLGCASHMAVLKNAETGDVKTCQTDSALAYTATDVINRYKQKACIKQLEKAGYKKVE
jgi:hypothetical protein